MNNDQNNAEGNALVSRLLNVLASEVLLTVEKRLNDLLTQQANQITLLQEKVELLGEKLLTVTAIKDRIAELENRMEDAECAIEDRPDNDEVERIAERIIEDADVVTKDDVRTMVDDAIEAADLISKDDAREQAQIAAEEVADRDALREVVDAAISEQELCDRGRVRELIHEEAFNTVRVGLRDILDGGKI